MWNSIPDERLRQWRQFRTEIGSKDFETALKMTSNLWSYAPYVAHYLHPDDVAEWPDPWVLLHDNYYCDIAKALGMLYTICLSDHYKSSIEKIELRIYKSSQDIFNLVWINNGKYILNLEFDTIVNKSSITVDYRLVQKITTSELKLDLE